jgi:hypothetical protein
MSNHQITSQAELRDSFWQAHPALSRGWKSVNGHGRPMTQNEYPTDTRLAWIDYVEAMQRSGAISEALADRATL